MKTFSDLHAKFCFSALKMKVEEFLALQEARAKRYGELNAAHRAYMSTAPDYDFEGFKKAVAEATDEFNAISKKIIAIQTEVDDEDLKRFITNVQNLEAEKLKFTVEYQLALQQSRDAPDDDLAERNVKGLQKKLNEIVEEINETLEEIRYKRVEIDVDR